MSSTLRRIANVAALLAVVPLCSAGVNGGAARTRADTQSIRVDGRLRTFVVRAPRGLASTGAPVPLVLVLHGGGGNAENAELMTGFTRLVDRERIMVVYAEGSSRGRLLRLLTWNARHCCGYAMDERVNDVGFIDVLLDTLIARYPIDRSRIYATGMSNGGMMSHRLGYELAPRFAAIAPVVGALFGDERVPASPVSALMINGLLDKSVPPGGGQTGGRSGDAWDGTPMVPQTEQGTFWARADGCAATPARAESAVETVWRYQCPTGRDVEVHQVKDNGHAWPGGQRGSRLGDVPSRSIDATEVIWTFFKAHPKAH